MRDVRVSCIQTINRNIYDVVRKLNCTYHLIEDIMTLNSDGLVILRNISR